MHTSETGVEDHLTESMSQNPKNHGESILAKTFRFWKVQGSINLESDRDLMPFRWRSLIDRIHGLQEFVWYAIQLDARWGSLECLDSTAVA